MVSLYFDLQPQFNIWIISYILHIIYILDIILGWVYDVISHLICIFYTLSWELMQVFANGKQCSYSFMEFYVLHLKKHQGVKIWSRCYFRLLVFSIYFSPFLNVLLQFSIYLLHGLGLLPVQEFLHHLASRPPCKQNLFLRYIICFVKDNAKR